MEGTCVNIGKNRRLAIHSKKDLLPIFYLPLTMMFSYLPMSDPINPLYFQLLVSNLRNTRQKQRIIFSSSHKMIPVREAADRDGIVFCIFETKLYKLNINNVIDKEVS